VEIRAGDVVPKWGSLAPRLIGNLGERCEVQERKRGIFGFGGMRTSMDLRQLTESET
jgi:hypothetical protein